MKGRGIWLLAGIALCLTACHGAVEPITHFSEGSQYATHLTTEPPESVWNTAMSSATIWKSTSQSQLQETAAVTGTAPSKASSTEITAPTKAKSTNSTAMFQTDLPFGSFYLKEVSTDGHYQLSDMAYPIEFSYAGQETAVVHLVANEGQPIQNNLIRGSVLGHKADENGQPVPGAVMGLFQADETEFTEDTALLTSVSNEHGEFRFDDIPLGGWLVREIRQPEGFLLSETVYPVTIAEQAQTVEIVVENVHIPSPPVNPPTGEDRRWLSLVIGLTAVAIGGAVALFIIKKKKG